MLCPGVDALIDCGALTAGADNAKIAGELLVLMEGNGPMLSSATPVKRRRNLELWGRIIDYDIL